MSEKCHEATCPLFDHLVGPGEQVRRHMDAECPGGLQIDNQIKLGRLLYWKLRRLRTLQNLGDVCRGPTISVGNTRSVGHETSIDRLLSNRSDCCSHLFCKLINIRQRFSRLKIHMDPITVRIDISVTESVAFPPNAKGSIMPHTDISLDPSVCTENLSSGVVVVKSAKDGV